MLGLPLASARVPAKAGPQRTPPGADWQAPRSAPDCSPLILGNCDAKALAASTAWRERRALAAWTDPEQSACNHARQGLDNLVEVDARARALTALSSDAPLGATERAALTELDDDAATQCIACDHNEIFVCDPPLVLLDFSQASLRGAHPLLHESIDSMSPPCGARADLRTAVVPTYVSYHTPPRIDAPRYVAGVGSRRAAHFPA